MEKAKIYFREERSVKSTWFKAFRDIALQQKLEIDGVSYEDYWQIIKEKKYSRMSLKKIFGKSYSIAIVDSIITNNSKSSTNETSNNRYESGNLCKIQMIKDKKLHGIYLFVSYVWIENTDMNNIYSIENLIKPSEVFVVSDTTVKGIRYIWSLLFQIVKNQMYEPVIHGIRKSKLSKYIPVSEIPVEIENVEKKIRNVQEETIMTDPRSAVDSRKCCKLTGRLGERYCGICGKAVPDQWIFS